MKTLKESILSGRDSSINDTVKNYVPYANFIPCALDKFMELGYQVMNKNGTHIESPGKIVTFGDYVTVNHERECATIRLQNKKKLHKTKLFNIANSVYDESGVLMDTFTNSRDNFTLYSAKRGPRDYINRCDISYRYDGEYASIFITVHSDAAEFIVHEIQKRL